MAHPPVHSGDHPGVGKPSTAVSTTMVPTNHSALLFDQLGKPANRPFVILASAAVVLSFSCCCFLLYRCFCQQREHRHVQLKDEDSGMPPQIVGSVDGVALDPDTFVIGDDDVDAEDEDFEYVHDVHDIEMVPPPPSPRGSGHAPSPRGSADVAAKGSLVASPAGGHGSDSGLRSAGYGSPRWDDAVPPATGLIPSHSDDSTLFTGPVFSGPAGPME